MLISPIQLFSVAKLKIDESENYTFQTSLVPTHPMNGSFGWSRWDPNDEPQFGEQTGECSSSDYATAPLIENILS